MITVRELIDRNLFGSRNPTSRIDDRTLSFDTLDDANAYINRRMIEERDFAYFYGHVCINKSVMIMVFDELGNMLNENHYGRLVDTYSIRWLIYR